MNMRLGSWFVVTACAIAVYFSHATPSFSSDNTSIQMLPPTDFNGNPCAGTNSGLLQWDGSTPIKCIPNTLGTANGYVGIGTTAPQYTLDVSGVNQAFGFRAQQGVPNNIDASTNGYAFGSDGDTGLFSPIRADGPANHGYDNGELGLFVNSFEAMHIQYTGNVGIGTSAPQATLDVENGSNTATMMQNGNPLGIVALTPGVLGPTDTLGQVPQTNGVANLPGGLIIQWGFTNYDSATGQSGTYTPFPETFPHNCFQIVASDCKYGAHGVGAQCNVSGMTSWGVIGTEYVGTCIRWIAIGN